MATIANSVSDGEMYFLPVADFLEKKHLDKLTFDKMALNHPCVILDARKGQNRNVEVALITSLGDKDFEIWRRKNQQLAAYRIPIAPLARRHDLVDCVLDISHAAAMKKASYVETHTTFDIPARIMDQSPYLCKLTEESLKDLRLCFAHARIHPYGRDRAIPPPNIRMSPSNSELSIPEQLARANERRKKSRSPSCQSTDTTPEATPSPSPPTNQAKIMDDNSGCCSSSDDDKTTTAPTVSSTRKRLLPPMVGQFTSCKRAVAVIQEKPQPIPATPFSRGSWRRSI